MPLAIAIIVLIIETMKDVKRKTFEKVKDIEKDDEII